jgi:hypothetical protein
MAAENSARACELHPLYIDVIVRRFEARAGTAAILADTATHSQDARKEAARFEATEEVANYEDEVVDVTLRLCSCWVS